MPVRPHFERNIAKHRLLALVGEGGPARPCIDQRVLKDLKLRGVVWGLLQDVEQILHRFVAARVGWADQNVAARIDDIGKAGALVKGDAKGLHNVAHLILFDQIPRAAVRHGQTQKQIEDIDPVHTADVGVEDAVVGLVLGQSLRNAFVRNGAVGQAARVPIEGHPLIHLDIVPENAVELVNLADRFKIACDIFQGAVLLLELDSQGVAALMRALHNGVDRLLPELVANCRQKQMSHKAQDNGNHDSSHRDVPF